MRGQLTPEQASVIAKYVKGQKAYDLGAGDLALSGALLELGARVVVAVDKSYKWEREKPPDTDRLYIVPSYFDEYAATDPAIDVAFVSWPLVYATQGLAELARRARTVLYLGSNFDGTACGSAELWQHLSKRLVLAESRHPNNTLIVYGPEVPGQRMQLPEEYAAIHNDGEWYPYGSLDGKVLL